VTRGVPAPTVSWLEFDAAPALNDPVRSAFKEWAVVVDALGGGDQILVLRKGGISEGPGGFQMEHREFWLFPTQYHPQAESVVASAAERHAGRCAAAPPDPARVIIEFGARVVEWHRLEDLAMANRLKGQHIWKDEVIAQRFDWGREQSIFAIAVRVLRLPSPVVLPVVPAYGGCKSWIELEQDLPFESAVPVLDDGLFGRRLEQFRKSVSVSAVV
jgi:hypothetical protein